jgi:hypothetical protein
MGALLVLIAAILLVGAVVGGVAGGVLGRKKSGASTYTATSTTMSSTYPTISATKSAAAASSTTSVAIPTSGIIALNCPIINGTHYTTQSGSSSYTFQILCQTDFRSTAEDIDSSLEYTFDSCINSCALRNSANQLPQCDGLTFDGNLTRFATANCFLKTGITEVVAYTVDLVQAGALWIH